MSSTTSLAELLEQTLGVVLDKTETLTNWVRRPLSEDQLAYAIEDVRYLHEARDVLQAHVEEIGRSPWLAEEMAAYDDPQLYEERDPREQFTRIKGTGRASSRELAILRELAAWREEEAQRCDRPRNHVLTDEVLVLLARRKPQSREELGRTRAHRQSPLRPLSCRTDSPRLGRPRRRMSTSAAPTAARQGGHRTQTLPVHGSLAPPKRRGAD